MKIFMSVLLGALMALAAPQLGSAVASLIYTPLAPLVALVAIIFPVQRPAVMPEPIVIIDLDNAEYLAWLLSQEVS